MQKDLITLSNIEQAKAVQDVNFLCYFLQPSSASDIAQELHMPANLVHHHVKRHVNLGILVEVKRERKKIFYQLSAKNFRYKHDLLPVTDSANYVSQNLEHIREAFLIAYEHTESLIPSGQSEWHTVGFESKEDTLKEINLDLDHPIEAFPPHFQSRTFKVDSESYFEMIRKINAVISDFEVTKDAKGEACTLSFLAFQNKKAKKKHDSHHFSSYAIQATKI